MKKLFTAIAFSALSAAAFASFNGAFGAGTIQVGSNTGVFGLSVRQGDGHTFGAAGYAELTPTHTVAAYITMTRVASATFTAHSVDFSGPGRMWANGTFSMVMVRIVADDNPTGTPDHFAIEARDAGGNVVYSASGDLTNGRIVVGQFPDDN